MPRLAAKFERGSYAGPFRQFGLAIDRRLELAALEATDKAAKVAVRSIRQAMAGAGLGRLGNGLGAASDLSSGRGIHRREAGGWSASGVVFVRSRSDRTRGAIEAYTGGADIAPKRGRWLWIATPDLQRVAGGKGKRAKVAAPIPVAAPAVEPVEAQEALAPTCDVPEPAIAPVAAPAVDLEAITARLDALEQALATLSAVSVDDREVTTSPVVVTEVASCDHLPKRTPAHERAIRRAWAERKARRDAEADQVQAWQAAERLYGYHPNHGRRASA